jgi:hypothetical protein
MTLLLLESFVFTDFFPAVEAMFFVDVLGLTEIYNMYENLIIYKGSLGDTYSSELNA